MLEKLFESVSVRRESETGESCGMKTVRMEWFVDRYSVGASGDADLDIVIFVDGLIGSVTSSGSDDFGSNKFASVQTPFGKFTQEDSGAEVA